MPMAATEIEALIRAALPDAVVEIRDLARDGDHYAAHATAERPIDKLVLPDAIQACEFR